MEVDTVSLSLISHETYQHLWPSRPLKASLVNLRTYSVDRVEVLGGLDVDVLYRDQIAKLPLLVIEGSGPNLFGRDWLARLKLDWKAIYVVNSHPVEPYLGLLKYYGHFLPNLFIVLSPKAGCVLALDLYAADCFHQIQSASYLSKGAGPLLNWTWLLLVMHLRMESMRCYHTRCQMGKRGQLHLLLGQCHLQNAITLKWRKKHWHVSSLSRSSTSPNSSCYHRQQAIANSLWKE